MLLAACCYPDDDEEESEKPISASYTDDDIMIFGWGPLALHHPFLFVYVCVGAC
jgi:hypothetical protein